MSIPGWYEFVLLGLAAWSVFQLLAYDDILDRPRRWALHLGPEWQEEGDPVPDDYRVKWALFLTCPYCAGFWIWLAWFGAFQISEFWTTFAAVAMGGRVIVVAGAKTLAKEEDKTVSPDAQVIAQAIVKLQPK